jgi:hypothetical protein
MRARRGRPLHNATHSDPNPYLTVWDDIERTDVNDGGLGHGTVDDWRGRLVAANDGPAREAMHRPGSGPTP